METTNKIMQSSIQIKMTKRIVKDSWSSFDKLYPFHQELRFSPQAISLNSNLTWTLAKGNLLLRNSLFNELKKKINSSPIETETKLNRRIRRLLRSPQITETTKPTAESIWRNIRRKFNNISHKLSKHLRYHKLTKQQSLYNLYKLCYREQKSTQSDIQLHNLKKLMQELEDKLINSDKKKKITKLSMIQKLRTIISIKTLDGLCWTQPFHLRSILPLTMKYGKNITPDMLVRIMQNTSPNAMISNMVYFLQNNHMSTTCMTYAEAYNLIEFLPEETVLFHNEEKKLLLILLDDSSSIGTLTGMSATVNKNMTAAGEKGSIAYEATEALQKEIAIQIFKNSIKIKYPCTDEEFECIKDAFPAFFVHRDPEANSIKVSHPHLKLFAEYLNNQVLNLDFKDYDLNVIGAKFNKQEGQNWNKANSVHYCLAPNNTETDPFRNNASTRSLLINERNKREQYKLSSDLYTSLMEEAKKTENMTNWKENMKRLQEISKEMLDHEEELFRIQDILNTLKTGELNRNCCTQGAENCMKENDAIISFDSIYDIDFIDLFRKAELTKTKEIYVTAIVPFGLKYVESYCSPELNVKFTRQNGHNGFMMTHLGDMSNGYIHENRFFMDIIETAYFKVPNGKFWYYEILDSVGEMVLMKFVPSSVPLTTVRKQLPPKFDSQCIVFNPRFFFSPIPKYHHIMLDKEKLESTIQFVERYKKATGIVEDVLTHVQSLHKSVIVGNTKLQTSARATPDEIDAYVLIGLLEGSCRRNEIGKNFYRANHGGLYILNRFTDFLKEALHSAFPNVVDFFTLSKVQRYIATRVNLADLILISDPKRSFFNKVFGFFSSFIEFEFDEDFKDTARKQSDFNSMDRLKLYNGKYLNYLLKLSDQRIKTLTSRQKNAIKIVEEKLEKIKSINTEHIKSYEERQNLIEKNSLHFDQLKIKLDQIENGEDDEDIITNDALNTIVISCTSSNTLPSDTKDSKDERSIKKKKPKGALPTAWCAHDSLKKANLSIENEFRKNIEKTRKINGYTDRYVLSQELANFLDINKIDYVLTYTNSKGTFFSGSSTDDKERTVYLFNNDYNVHWEFKSLIKYGLIKAKPMTQESYQESSDSYSANSSEDTLYDSDASVKTTDSTASIRSFNKKKNNHGRIQTVPNNTNDEFYPTPHEIVKKMVNALIKSTPKGLSVTDHCTGTGRIANELLKTGHFSQVHATDITERPSSLNKEIHYRKIDLSKTKPSKTDIVITNPPFGADRDYRTVAREVIKTCRYSALQYLAIINQKKSNEGLKEVMLAYQKAKCIHTEDISFSIGNMYKHAKNLTRDLECNFSIFNYTEYTSPVKSDTPQNKNQIKVKDLNDAAKRYNLERQQQRTIIKSKDLPALTKKYTKPGFSQPIELTRKEAENALNTLNSIYQIESATSLGRLHDLKESVIELIKYCTNNIDNINLDKINIKVIDGYAGAGKTFYIKEHFNPITDAYIAPFSDVCVKTHQELKEKFGKNQKINCKTYEKINELNKNSLNGTLFVDEASAYAYEYLVLIALAFNYKEIRFIGDRNQTKYYDITGESSTKEFKDFVKEENIEIMYYTMRFGPAVAYLLNHMYEYPVFSLCNTFTTINLRDKDTLNADTQGTNICAETETANKYRDFLRNVVVAKASQGRTYPISNIMAFGNDIDAFTQYRANGIVAFSRVSDELNIYVDRTAKKSKQSQNLINFLISFETTLGITLYDKLNSQDF